MSVKTLVILLVVLALVGGIAMLATRKPAQEQSVEAGDRLLQDLEVNSITFVEISQGVETTRLERIDGTWCVANRFNYPADFER
ncbi:MAG: hypothetical protein EOM20_16755, partial [Spartobacteria bacterium]|nr:hypothetical protein [Spartobacteria bacterium]